MRGLSSDLRRFLRTSRVIELGAAFALATVGVETIATFVNSLIVSPVQNSDSNFSPAGGGTFAIDHRVFDFEDPLFQLLILALVVGAVMLVVRWSRDTLFGDEIFQWAES